MTSERGFSLLEQLVATAAFALAATISLALFDSARKAFEMADNVAEAQQAARVAMHRITADLRMAGLNVNPDGDPTRPDESIESAHEAAIVLRGDFDGGDPEASREPESELGGGAFLTVTTGNDEVVAYVLAKPDGSSTGALVFEADMGEAPRDGVVEEVHVPKVALIQDEPPYTLYRITFGDPGELGARRFAVRAPLIDNVESLVFRYYDENGVALPASVPEEPFADPGADSERRRARIRGVSVELGVLTRDADLRRIGPARPGAGGARRRFRLAGFVLPRNLGRVGRPDRGTVDG